MDEEDIAYIFVSADICLYNLLAYNPSVSKKDISTYQKALEKSFERIIVQTADYSIKKALEDNEDIMALQDENIVRVCSGQEMIALRDVVNKRFKPDCVNALVSNSQNLSAANHMQ